MKEYRIVVKDKAALAKIEALEASVKFSQYLRACLMKALADPGEFARMGAVRGALSEEALTLPTPPPAPAPPPDPEPAPAPLRDYVAPPRPDPGRWATLGAEGLSDDTTFSYLGVKRTLGLKAADIERLGIQPDEGRISVDDLSLIIGEAVLIGKLSQDDSEDLVDWLMEKHKVSGV